MSTLNGILSLQRKMDTKFQLMQNFFTRFLQLLILHEKKSRESLYKCPASVFLQLMLPLWSQFRSLQNIK